MDSSPRTDPDPANTATTAESAVLQALQRHPDALGAFACGDRTALDTLKNAALRAAGEKFDEAEIAEALTRKLREGL